MRESQLSRVLNIGFRPVRYINVSTTRFNCRGLSTSTPKRYKRENNANHIESVKTMMNRNRCDNRKILTTLLALRYAAYQATPSRRNTTTTLPRLVPGFSSVREGAWVKGYTRRPQGRHVGAHGRHRVAVGQADKDFSRLPTNHDPRRSIALHQREAADSTPALEGTISTALGGN